MVMQLFERETVIFWDDSTDIATVETYNTAFDRKMQKLASERPDEVRVKPKPGWAAEYYIPKSWIKVQPPRKMSDEERARRAETRHRFNQPSQQ